MDYRWVFAALFTLLAFLPACDGDEPASADNLILLVELKTDLIPGVEFAAVRTQLFDTADRADELTRRQVDVAFGRDLTTGLRVAELGELGVGTYLVRVTLVDLGDIKVLGRDVVVTVRETAGVTVLMTRDCLGIECPMSGDDPTASVCLGGWCVEERCSPEAPEFCPVPECSAAPECTDMVSSCAERACEDGTCFVRTHTSMCGGEEYCDPTSGCVAAPSRPDGGAGDAAVGMPGWAQEVYVKASNTGDGDLFGHVVSLSADGHVMAVGTPMEGSTATKSGAVYVFIRSDGRWTQEAHLKASNTDTFDRFGWSVSLSEDGSVLAVGAPREDSSARGPGGDQDSSEAFDAGAAYVFTRSAGTWTQDAYLKASNTGVRDAFGTSLSLSADGRTLAVGAPGEESAAFNIDGNQDDDTAPEAGAVYLFDRGASVWAQQAYLKAFNTGTGDAFGSSVSLSGDGATLAVGATGEDSSVGGVDALPGDDLAPGAGAVYVFRRAFPSWGPGEYLKASNAEADDAFGWSVSLSANGDLLAVGAQGEGSNARSDEGNNSAYEAGAVYVFTWTGGGWAQEAYLKASNAAAAAYFGEAVSLSADGSRLVVGAANESSLASVSGAAYVFTNGGGTWPEEGRLKALTPSADDHFAGTVALSANGMTLAVGANQEDGTSHGVGGDDTALGGAETGAVYVFSFTP